MPRAKSTRTISRSIRIQASARRVLDAFLDVELMKQWWGATRGLVEARKGGVYALGWSPAPPGYQYVVCGVLKSFAPGRRLRIEPLVYFNAERPVLGPMGLAISVREKEGGTRLTVRQDGYGEGPDWDWYHQAVLQGWKDALRNVKRFLERSQSPGRPAASAKPVT